MSASSARSFSGSRGVLPDAGGQAGSAMQHGGAGPSVPPGIFIDPSHWGQRELGQALVAKEWAHGVEEDCQTGYGGARAWGKATGSCLPRLWMAFSWSSKRPAKRASLCDGSAWPVVPLGSGGTAAHRLRGAAIPTQRWAICVTRHVKWAVALDLDSWTAEQRVVWAAVEEDAEGMSRGVGTGLRSRRGAKRLAWMTRASDIRWEVRSTSDVIL